MFKLHIAKRWFWEKTKQKQSDVLHEGEDKTWDWVIFPQAVVETLQDKLKLRRKMWKEPGWDCVKRQNNQKADCPSNSLATRSFCPQKWGDKEDNLRINKQAV